MCLVFVRVRKKKIIKKNLSVVQGRREGQYCTSDALYRQKGVTETKECRSNELTSKRGNPVITGRSPISVICKIFGKV